MNASVHADFCETVTTDIGMTSPGRFFVEADFVRSGKSETFRVFGLTYEQAAHIAEGFNRAFPKPLTDITGDGGYDAYRRDMAAAQARPKPLAEAAE